VDKIDKLWAIEEIKQLKARYFRFADTRQHDGFLDVFTDDIHWVLYDRNNVDVLKEINGKQEYRKWLDAINEVRMAGRSVHHGHMPEIEITDENNARGIWAMMDYLENPGMSHYIGYGHYHEQYRRCDDGKWRIANVEVTRLRVDDIDPV
jgi:hypothetical protein